VQLVIGGVLYGLRYSTFAERFSANPAMLRFWKMEHIGTMVLAVALITIGRILSKKAKTEDGKQLRIAIFFTIGLLLILAMIPWPFMAKFSHAYGWL
jgi:undecaprenyl pyrophosphate phosphatase UppP